MTSLGIDLADLGFAPVDDVPERVPAEPVNDGRTLIVGSILAKALYSVRSGAPLTIVDSLPAQEELLSPGPSPQPCGSLEADAIFVGAADRMQGGQ
ncbi:hypothetical protein ACIP9X_20345 [Arthrobacter sp. NPDC093125]|uniref:hypothetical protein n=1 Tax=Arthrobacter sp. NPDC093125 TaxID=3363944 RepID=UPI003817490F